jgi:hypothetical protein
MARRKCKAEHRLTPGEWLLEVGKDRCFHRGNRVAITVIAEDGDEAVGETIAELWPAGGDQDIRDGRAMAAAKRMTEALMKIHDEADHALGTEEKNAALIFRQNMKVIRKLAASILKDIL